VPRRFRDLLGLASLFLDTPAHARCDEREQNSAATYQGKLSKHAKPLRP
jgi:hypothetical protein